MAKAQRKTANDSETGVVTNQPQSMHRPQFTVLPPPGAASAASVNPFGDADPLAAIGESAAKKTGGKSYPHATLTDPQRKQIDELNRQKIEAAALKGSIEVISGLLSPIVTDQYITGNIGLAEVPSGILAAGVVSESLITLCGDSGGKYKEVPKTQAVELLTLIGGNVALFNENFCDATSLTIKMSDVPDSVRPALSTALVALFQEHGCLNCLARKSIIAPTPHFKATRWQRFDLATNLALNRVIPIQASFRKH